MIFVSVHEGSQVVYHFRAEGYFDIIFRAEVKL